MSKNKSEKELVVRSENSEKSENVSAKSESISTKSGNNPESGIALWWKETLQFLREVWIEVRPNKGRVTWPTWASVRISTRVVIISSLGLGLFIGLCDMIFAYAYQVIMNSASNGLG